MTHQIENDIVISVKWYFIRYQFVKVYIQPPKK